MEVRKVQYLFQDYGTAFQTTPFTGSQVNLWSGTTFQLLHNVVVLLARQMGCQPGTIISSEHTSKQSSLESLELAELSNDRMDIFPGALVEGVWGKVGRRGSHISQPDNGMVEIGTVLRVDQVKKITVIGFRC